MSLINTRVWRERNIRTTWICAIFYKSSLLHFSPTCFTRRKRPENSDLWNIPADPSCSNISFRLVLSKVSFNRVVGYLEKFQDLALALKCPRRSCCNVLFQFEDGRIILMKLTNCTENSLLYWKWIATYFQYFHKFL